MINYQKLYGLIGLATKAGKITAGSDACLEAMQKHSSKFILLAQDASDRTKKTFNEKCKEYHIPIYEILTIDEISKAIGKQNKAVVSINEKGFAEAMVKIINGGEMIG